MHAQTHTQAHNKRKGILSISVQNDLWQNGCGWDNNRSFSTTLRHVTMNAENGLYTLW